MIKQFSSSTVWEPKPRIFGRQLPKGLTLYKLPARSVIDKLATDLRAQLIPSKLQRRIVGIDVADPARGIGVAAAPAPEAASAFVAASNALYKAAVEPAAGVIGEKRLLVVADGALNYVPFEALVKAVAGGDYSSLPYLVKHKRNCLFAFSVCDWGDQAAGKQNLGTYDVGVGRSGFQFK